MNVDARIVPEAGTIEFRNHERHPQDHTCPRCGDDLNRVGLHKVVYAFAVCTVDHEQGFEPYDHIYEQLWHRACLIENNEPVGW